MASDHAPASVLSVRVSADERALLQAASENASTTLSDFVRRKAIEAAELEIMSRAVVTIPAEKWDEFEAWLHRPPERVEALARLAAMKPPWE